MGIKSLQTDDFKSIRLEPQNIKNMAGSLKRVMRLYEIYDGGSSVNNY